MSDKKPRKSLEDALAKKFVYGSQDNQESQPTQPGSEPLAAPPSKEPQPKNKSLMDELQAPAKEPITRFTVDMPESMHRDLSLLAAKTGRKKVDLVRLAITKLLEDAKE